MGLVVKKRKSLSKLSGHVRSELSLGQDVVDKESISDDDDNASKLKWTYVLSMVCPGRRETEPFEYVQVSNPRSAMTLTKAESEKSGCAVILTKTARKAFSC